MEPVLVSKHIIKLDASHERLGTQSRLSVLDTLNGRYIIHFGYVYQKHEQFANFDTTLFRESLETTLNYFPEFTGSLVKTKRGFVLNFDNNGVEFSVYSSDLKFEDAIKNKNSGMFLHAVDPGQKELLRIKMTILHDQSYTFGFDFSHAISDCWSFVWFLNAWSRVFHKDNNFGLPNISVGGSYGSYRSSFVEDRCIITRYGNKEKIESFPDYALKRQNPPDDCGEFNIELLLSKARLSKFKSEFLLKRTKSDPEFISTTDIISALTWKAVVKAKQMEKDQNTKLIGCKNIRKDFEMDESYLGNCVMAYFTKLLALDLTQLDVINVACLIRKEIISLDKRNIKSKLTFMESADNWFEIERISDLAVDFVMVSWEQFPLLDVDFNYGKLWRFIPPTILSSSLSYILPTKNKDELSLVLRLKESQMAVFLEDPDIKNYFKLQSVF